MSDSSNLERWKRGGDSLLVVQPFMDNLIVRGEGCHLVDAEGRRILDLAAGQFCSILGHNHAKFAARLIEQITNGIHLGDQYVSPGVLAAAQRLVAVTPITGGKVIFLSTGSEANECAMRMAKAVTGRTGMLGYTRGYYGITLATRNLSSITETSGKVDLQPSPAGQFKLLTPSPNHCPIGLRHAACTGECLGASFETIGDQRHGIAAVIVETVISAGGMIFPPVDYLQALHARAREMGALFIVDEAQTGLGRCGTWFDIEHYGIVPDILVLSKTAGNGYPIGAVVVSAAVAEKLESQGFSHLSSHQNDPLAAATVHAVIDIVEEEGLVDKARTTGAHFLERLRELASRHPSIVDVRGRGLMIGMELATSTPQRENVALVLAWLCEQRGVHITYTYLEPVIRFIPPLLLSQRDVDEAIGVIDDALTVVESRKQDLAELMPSNPRSRPYVERMHQGLSASRIVRGMWNTPPRDWVDKFKKL